MGEEKQERVKLWDETPGYDLIEEMDLPAMHSWFLDGTHSVPPWTPLYGWYWIRYCCHGLKVACEELSIRTALIAVDQSTDVNSSEGALLFNTPNADAIVNVGSFSRLLTLPPVKRVIGGSAVLLDNKPALGEIEITPSQFIGPVSQLGAGNLMMREV